MPHLLRPSCSGIGRQAVLGELRNEGISAVFHYVPRHPSPAGQRYGRVEGGLQLTTSLSERLIRLPIWLGLSENQRQRICDVLAAS